MAVTPRVEKYVPETNWTVIGSAALSSFDKAMDRAVSAEDRREIGEDAVSLLKLAVERDTRRGP